MDRGILDKFPSIIIDYIKLFEGRLKSTFALKFEWWYNFGSSHHPYTIQDRKNDDCI